MKIDLSLDKDELYRIDMLLENAMDNYAGNKSNKEYTELEDLSYKVSQAIDKLEN